MSTRHKNLPAGKTHVAHCWEYEDETEREAAIDFVSADIGKLALQLDDWSFWVLTSTGPTWVAVGGSGGGGGGLVLLETQVASGSASLDFVSLSDAYNNYVLKISGLIPAAAGNNLIVRLATDAVPTWDSGSNYRWFRKYMNVAGAEGVSTDGGATSNMQIAAVVGTGAGFSVNAEIRFNNLRTAALYKTLQSDLDQQISSDSNLYWLHSIGLWTNNSVKAFGIQLLMSSGNIASGVACLYGVEE